MSEPGPSVGQGSQTCLVPCSRCTHARGWQASNRLCQCGCGGAGRCRLQLALAERWGGCARDQTHSLWGGQKLSK